VVYMTNAAGGSFPVPERAKAADASATAATTVAGPGAAASAAK
jgi:hypothetical protein